MANISIISAWASETGHLLQDYYQAVQGAQVVSVDNACPEATQQALAEMTEHMQGVYLRNDTNLGFAAANNQGYAQATGDIIIFLNSDVAPTGPWLAAVAADVKPGGLYGPSIQHQLVYGNWWPYLEGWCIAATRETWEALTFKAERVLSDCERGPWDATSYPGPYWEDNDLALRAQEAGFSLIHTAWPIAHKGGQTAGAILKWGKTFEANRATFAKRCEWHWESWMQQGKIK